MKAVFDRSYIKNLDGTHIKQADTKYALAKALMEDMTQFQDTRGCDRLVIVWCGSTEKYIEVSDVHESLGAFEKGLKENDPRIAPSMIYAYAALKLGIPFLNGAPNLTVDIPALVELSNEEASSMAPSAASGLRQGGSDPDEDHFSPRPPRRRSAAEREEVGLSPIYVK